MKKKVIYYNDFKSTDRVTEIEGETEDSIFEQFYKMNNRLRYCNGSYFKFEDKEDKEDEANYYHWRKSLPKQRSFDLFYDGGIVD